MARGGVRAWQFLRLIPAYRKAWQRRGRAPGLPLEGPLAVQLQTWMDLKAARWGLLAWMDPDETGPVSPFWSVAPTLDAEVAPDATPLIPRLDALGASFSGLRMADGGLMLKIELARAAVQMRIAGGSLPGAGDGVVAEHDLLLAPSAFIRLLEDACALVAGEVPQRGGGWGMERWNCPI